LGRCAKEEEEMCTEGLVGKVGLDLGQVVLEGLVLELDKVRRHVGTELSRPGKPER
jgi:hypothetical protein